MLQAGVLPLSVIIITKNAQRHLHAVLSPIADIAAEIIIVDSGSTDDTLAIAESFGAKITSTPTWPGFGPQKNIALSQVTQDWVLSLDADEVISAKLKEQIKQCVQSNQAIAYEVDRITCLWGHPMMHSGLRPEWRLRLFPRNTAKFTDNILDDEVYLTQPLPIQQLDGEFWHYCHDDLEGYLHKINNYSTVFAKRYVHEEGQKSSLSKALYKAIYRFIRTYFFKKGFLDGKFGLMNAIADAEYMYYKYLKAFFVYENKKNETR